MKTGRKIQHGHHTREFGKTKEYAAWDHMKGRCNNPNDKRYSDYGGRGITVCERWLKFENFLEDMGIAPSPKHSLDRINNDGNYEPGNCRWVINKIQLRNTRMNVFIEYQGQTLTIAEWSEKLNIPHHIISYRIKHGWSPEEALTTPSKTQRNLGNHPKAD